MLNNEERRMQYTSMPLVAVSFAAGTSVALHLQSHNGKQNAVQQGVVRFAPQTSAAGPAPSLSYTSKSCQ